MITKKEVVSILLLVIAVICILNAALFGSILPTTSSFSQLVQQIISSGTAYICVIFGLSTWLYHSSYSEPTQQMRFVLMSMVVLMILLHLTALVMIVKTYFDSEVVDAVDLADLFTSFGFACRIMTLILCIITIVLLILVLFLLIRITVDKLQMSYPKQKEMLP